MIDIGRDIILSHVLAAVSYIIAVLMTENPCTVYELG